MMRGPLVNLMLSALIIAGCSTLRAPPTARYSFPKDAYLNEPPRAYETLGLVKTMVDYLSLNPDWDEQKLCENYFNKAAQDLLKRARDAGGDAVIGVRSVVFLIDGKTETFSSAECSDDGQEGQVLAQGIAVKWIREKPLPGAKPVPIDSAPSKASSDPLPQTPRKLRPKRKKTTREVFEAADTAPSLRPTRREPLRPNEPVFVDPAD